MSLNAALQVAVVRAALCWGILTGAGELALAATSATTTAELPRCIQDDTQATVCTQANTRTQRVLSLAPHLTETVAFVGGQPQLIAVDDASDYPKAIQGLPKLLHPHMANIEHILAFKPTLVLVWQSGFASRLVAQLRGMGIAVFVSEPLSIDQVATTMQRLAVLLGTQAYATPHIAAWQQGWQHLPAWNRNTTTAQAQRGPVRVFYQAWAKPLMALGGSHVVSDVLARCGATNVLQHVHKLAINLNPEALLPLQPELILSSGPASNRTNLQKQWASWQGLPAVRHGYVALVPPSILVRNGPRLLEAAHHVCANVAAVATHPQHTL